MRRQLHSLKTNHQLLMRMRSLRLRQARAIDGGQLLSGTMAGAVLLPVEPGRGFLSLVRLY